MAWYEETKDSTDNGQILNVLGSMSANIGIQFQCNIAAAAADMVHVGTITSSPGDKPSAPTAHIRPDVQELTEITCFTLKY